MRPVDTALSRVFIHRRFELSQGFGDTGRIFTSRPCHGRTAAAAAFDQGEPLA